jgi:hypothetical protein
LGVRRYNCPGDPPGNLAAFDCNFTKMMRLEHLITSSVTDQAMLGALFTGAFAHLRNDPEEWSQSWNGLGRRVLSRYERKFLGGVTEYSLGALMKTDPRHVTYAADPLIANRRGGTRARIGHAFMDWATVRRSSKSATGARLPNVPLFAGALANGFSGRYWYPPREATTSRSLRRALGPLETALVGSFYAEFGPEVGRALGAMFKHKREK